MLSIGLMSGTSMDGIDATLLRTDGDEQIEELAQVSLAYDPRFKILLKSAEKAVRQHLGDLTLAQAAFSQVLNQYLEEELHQAPSEIPSKIKELAAYLQINPEALSLELIIQQSSEHHLQAVLALLKAASLSPEQIDVIGYPGQTLFHRPSLKRSVIVANAHYLAKATGITVVSDFRAHDIAQGGQGAPFAPLFHQALALRDQVLPLAVVNCGGISNITLIPSNNPNELLAFDSGPGNGLVDRLVRQRTQGQFNMDKDGVFGKKGQVNEACLKALHQKALNCDGVNYFEQEPPKALDIGDCHLIPELDKLSLEDACATLETFTAESIVKALDWSKGIRPSTWILAGGGWHNPVIYAALKEHLEEVIGPSLKLYCADEIGWNNNTIEAQIFAYFAVRALQNKPLSMPGTTGVPKPLSGGQAHLPPLGASERVKELIEKNPAVLEGYR